MGSANLCHLFFPGDLWWTKTSHAHLDPKLNSKGHVLWPQNLDGRKVLLCAGIQCGLVLVFLLSVTARAWRSGQKRWSMKNLHLSNQFPMICICYQELDINNFGTKLRTTQLVHVAKREGMSRIVINVYTGLQRLTGWVLWLRSLTEHALWV